MTEYLVLKRQLFTLRYGNIIPYDRNRVILSKPIMNCNYVNASWIRKGNSFKEVPTFIAAQGPMANTCPHFLQMIFENKVKTIVMLTSLTEQTCNGNIVVECLIAHFFNLGSHKIFLGSSQFLG
jgi:protein tyrosine phosphatase